MSRTLILVKMRVRVIVCLLAHMIAAGGVITVLPAENTFIASPSSDNITYTCEVNDNDVTLLWQVHNEQIRTRAQVEKYANNSVFVQGEGTSLKLVFTPQGRLALRAHQHPVPIMCISQRPNVFQPGESSHQFHIFQFDAPGPVVGLKLTHDTEKRPILQWSSRKDSRLEVSHTYLVNITNPATSVMILSTETAETYVHVPVGQIREGMCQPHNFTVSARNDAGESLLSTLMESIPLSVNISPVSRSQSVDRVQFTDSNVYVTVSFQPARFCSVRFPVLKHTVSVEGLNGSVDVLNSTSKGIISVILSSADIPQFTVNQVYDVIITACSTFSCERPRQPLLAVTTDTQSASAVFYGTAVSLNCSFAENTSAIGCHFVFHLTNDDLTENVTVNYAPDDGNMFNTSCDQLTNTRAAYDDVILVYDIEEDGSIGLQPITATVVVEEESHNFTCPLPSNYFVDYADGEPPSSGGDDLDTGAIAGIAIASVLAAIFLGLSITLLIFLFLVKKERKAHTNQSWSDSVKVVLGHLVSDWDATDNNKNEFEAFPVAMVTCTSEKSVSMHLVQCEDTSRWIDGLLERGNTVYLYPERLSAVAAPTSSSNL